MLVSHEKEKNFEEGAARVVFVLDARKTAKKKGRTRLNPAKPPLVSRSRSG